MGVFTSLGILVLSVLIIAFLQFISGIFLLTRHYASGKYSRVKASDLSLFFIFGVETALALIFVLVYFILSSSPIFSLLFGNEIFTWSMFTIFLLFSIISLFFYFRKGSGTKLFLSRSLASKYHTQAKSIKNRSDSFMLGLSSVLPELILTLPLIILSSTEIMKIAPSPFSSASLILLFIIIIITPLLAIHILYNKNYNLADFIKFRFKNKNFFRSIISLFYLILATLVIVRSSL